MHIYKYQPLSSSNSIRILELLPGEYSDNIICCLRSISLSSAQPEYDAVSYMWGDATSRIAVSCDAAAIEITRNLHEALRSFRNKSSSTYLWVDAICIDQINLTEKSQQVSIMRLIYQRAGKVRIWLGGEDQSSRMALPLIREIFTSIENGHSPILSGGEVVFQKTIRTTTDPESFVVSNKPSHYTLTVTDQQWRAIGRFLCRPYFSRLWVLQEATANTLVTASCGTHSLDFSIITGFAEWLCQVDRPRGNLSILDRCNNINKGYYHASLMSERRLRGIGILEMLQMGRECLCTDPRDKVYGLLSLLFQGTITHFGRTGSAQPDYEASVQDVYKKTVCLAVDTTQNLDVLRYVHHSGHLDTEFPSWVPRWDIWHACPKFGISEWHASKDSKAKLVNAEAENAFCAYGIPFGSITSVAYRYGTHEDNKLWADMFEKRFNVSCWAEFLALEETSPTGKDLLQEFSLMLTASNFSTGQRVDGQQAVADFAAYLYEHTKNGWEDVSLLGITVLKNAAELYFLRKKAGPGDWNRFRRASGSGYQTRPVFMTEEGYFGLGPDIMEPGDVCCILFGGSVPFILRPTEQHFMFLGESYIQGVMEGEVIHLWQEGNLQERILEIR